LSRVCPPRSSKKYKEQKKCEVDTKTPFTNVIDSSCRGRSLRGAFTHTNAKKVFSCDNWQKDAKADKVETSYHAVFCNTGNDN
jgi:hypothetical protein